MARLSLVVALALLSACSTQQPPPVASAPTAPGEASVADAAVEEDDGGGMSTEAKVAIGLGIGALAAFLIYGAALAVGTSAILASG